MKFRFAHEFNVSPTQFWTVFFSKDYNEDLYKQLKFISYQLIELQQMPNSIKRVQKVEPSSTLPTWAQSIVPSMAYVEYDLYNKDKSVMEVKIEPVFLKERFSFHGIYRVSSLPNARCLREYEAEVKVSIPLLGGKVEKLVVEQFQAAEPTNIAVTEKWLAKTVLSNQT